MPGSDTTANGARHDDDAPRAAIHAVVADLEALERLVRDDRFDPGPRRIAAVQDMFLIDRGWAPAPAAIELVDRLRDPHYATGLGRFQLAASVDPQVFAGAGLTLIEDQLTALIARTRSAAVELGLAPVLVGILPTLRKSDLGVAGMVPSWRMRVLARAGELRGAASELEITGTDELIIDDAIMLEACNASFEVQLQVSPAEFPRMYNIAQVLAAPLLAIAANAPLLLGRRLWADTRIALVRHAVDARSRDGNADLSFGTRWVSDSVLELYREDVARLRAMVGDGLDDAQDTTLGRADATELRALGLHDAASWRWNRPCYGVVDGKPQLRIASRVMPAGPSILDEVANAAMWFGAMAELAARGDDVTRQIEFEQADANFTIAAREGIGAHFTWLDGEDLSVAHLVLDRLLPLAEAGLRRQGIAEADLKRYLAVVDNRVHTARTGARWMMSSWSALRDKATAGERANALVAATVQRQQTGRPVAEWERARLDEADLGQPSYHRVDQCMTTDLFTVDVSDPVELVVNLMSWERIRHILVEDSVHRLLGLVTFRAVLRFLASGASTHDTPVSEIMKTEVTTVGAEARTLDALHLMRRYRFGCLPVVQNGELVGILTEEDFTAMASKLLEQQLGEARR